MPPLHAENDVPPEHIVAKVRQIEVVVIQDKKRSLAWKNISFESFVCAITAPRGGRALFAVDFEGMALNLLLTGGR